MSMFVHKPRERPTARVYSKEPGAQGPKVKARREPTAPNVRAVNRLARPPPPSLSDDVVDYAITAANLQYPSLQQPAPLPRIPAQSTSNLLSVPPADPFQPHFSGHQSAQSDGYSEEALCGKIHAKFNSIITAIDEETFLGQESDLVIHEEQSISGLRGGGLFKSSRASRSADRAISSTLISINYFAKVNLYANAKLPPHLPLLRLYLPSYQLLCLAADYSQRAYEKPSGAEKDAFVNADGRLGTKPMVIKSMPLDDRNCVVFAIRGTSTFKDWAVNLRSAPVAADGFLDDPGNLCHSGFLSVARKMIAPVAARLRQLLEENPGRTTCSLLMTGHSAGGAVASLLYAHMLAEHAQSELNVLTGCFKRIHCLTFGTPPISLLPLTKPTSERYKKSLFMSFINEGDPVPRADPAYVRSLLRLYASPAPPVKTPAAEPARRLPFLRSAKPIHSNSAPAFASKAYIWEVPPGTLSNAGRLVVLRGSEGVEVAHGEEEDVKAEITCDQELRHVVFGNPLMHMMNVYARRIEVLATKAVTGRT